METDLETRLNTLEAKLDAVQVSIDKIRRYFQIITWITIIMVVLPLLGLLIAIPAFIRTYTSTFGGLI